MNKTAVLAAAAVAVAIGVLCLAFTVSAGEGLAFPLDDSWIHQTYARSLALTGEWAFLPGQPSAGSTAPLWTLLLAAGYALGVDGVWWSHGLGIVLLALTGLAAGRLAAELFPGRARLPLAVALLCASEWHLAWAAVSGMETLLFTVLSLALLAVTAAPLRRGTGLGIGVLGGCLALTRPEGIVLFALCCLALGWRRLRAREWSALALDALAAGGACALLLAPLVWFNLSANGTPFPNTFSAKQQEYRSLLETPYVWRWLQLAAVPLVGPAALLLPGVAALAAPGVRRSLRSDGASARPPAAGAGLAAALPAVWWLAFVSLYAWRLPVTYQHGRYLIPTIPILIVYGAAGLAALLDPRARAAARRVPSRAALALLVAVPVAFAVVGARAYRDDVRVINRETVAAARWVRDHTPAGALVAAHDVGALGYFGDRPLVDLAGLVSPEAIAYLGDPAAAAAYVRARGADYLMQGLGFEYPALTGAPGVERVYTTAGLWPEGAGHPHIEIYRLK